MIFKPELITSIQVGSKTMTRRRLPCPYKAERSYAVQPGRGKRHVFHIWPYAIREERLGDITNEDAEREGFRNVSEFVDYWMGLYGAYNPHERVAVIEWAAVEWRKRCCPNGGKPLLGDLGDQEVP